MVKGIRDRIHERIGNRIREQIYTKEFTSLYVRTAHGVANRIKGILETVVENQIGLTIYNNIRQLYKTII